MVETVKTIDTAKARYTVCITESGKRRAWKAYKRKAPMTIEFLLNPDPSPLKGVYQVCLRLDTGTRRRLPIRGCYRYEYEGQTAFGAPFTMTFGHDLFDFRESLDVAPPVNPMDWALTFS